MELVYLWVEDYKNIHGQGFNFSPRFNCDFDGKNLTIDDNPDYIENFFGDNINVTAIVGKNGSGKSSLLELLNRETYQYIDNYQQNFKDFFSTNSIILIHDKLNDKIILYSKFLLKENIITNITYLLEREKYFSGILKSSNINISQLEESQEIISFLTKEIISLPFKAPIYLSIGFHDNFGDFNTYINISYEVLETHGKKEKQLIAYEIYLMIAYLKNNDIKCNDCNMDNLAPHIIVKKLQEKINNSDIMNKIKKIIDTIKDKFIYSESYSSLTIKIEDLPNDFMDDYNKLISGNHKYHKYAIILFDFYPKISTGEYQFLLLFSQLYKNLKSDPNNLLCIDEGESFLHPNWQKKYLSYISKFIKDNFPSRKIHIILTSPSPFLLSDIPKQNIIFLDTYKEDDKDVKDNKQKVGNCKVLKHDEVLQKKQTFGANIHTLLSDSFFMEDGLMGEFAKGKINEIIEFHNITKKKKYKKCLQKIYEKREKGFRQTQSIVGDPYLKQVLENHLLEIDKFFDKKVAKEKLKARLKKQLAELDDD